jgi:hypothetical protein
MPVYNTTPITPEIQEQLTIMASTDIRSMLANLEAATQQGTANATTIASQGVTLADVKATAVVEKNFTLQKAAFVLEGDVYRALIQHDMGSKFPGVTIYDNGGDLQMAEFIAIDPTSCKLELTATQWADNDFPLTVNLQARNVATVATSVGMSGYAVPGTSFTVRNNVAANRVEQSVDSGVNWNAVQNTNSIASAEIGADKKLYIHFPDGNNYVMELGVWFAASTGLNSTAVIAIPGSIAL